MNTRLTCAAVLGAIGILVTSSGVAAQTADTRGNPSAVQAPATATHQHDHSSPPAEVKTDARGSCCEKAATTAASDAPASPAAAQQQDTKAASEKGCGGGMMNSMKKDQSTADQSPAEGTHSCCCAGMKM